MSEYDIISYITHFVEYSGCDFSSCGAFATYGQVGVADGDGGVSAAGNIALFSHIPR